MNFMSKVFSLTKFWVCRVGVVYLILWGFFSQTVDWKKLQMRFIGEARIPLDYLIYFSDNEEAFNEAKFKDQLVYYTYLNKAIPRNSEIKGLLGFCYYYLGDTQKALRYFKEAARLNPRMFWYHYNLGIIYFRDAKYAEAIEHLRVALAQSPGFALKVVRISKIYRYLDDPIFDSDGLPALSNRDVHALQVKNIEEAYRNVYRLLILCFRAPKNARALIAVSQLALEANVSGKAFFYYHIAEAAFSLKDFPNTFVALDKAIKEDPAFKDAYRLLGRCYRVLGNSKKAKLYFQKAELIKEDSSDSKSNLSADLNLKIF